jgi:hypothetical protein
MGLLWNSVIQIQGQERETWAERKYTGARQVLTIVKGPKDARVGDLSFGCVDACLVQDSPREDSPLSHFCTRKYM